MTSGRAPAEWRLTGQGESGDRLSLSCPPPAGLPLHCSAMPAPTQGRLPSPCQAGSPVPPLRRTHRSHPPSASPPPAPHTLPWGWRGEERREEQPNLVAGTMGRPFPTCPRTSFPAPGEATPETARSFRQCPGPHSLPQIQGPWGGAEGQTEVGGLPAPTPSTASLEPTSLRFPPALKIVLADASQVPLATSFWTGNSVRSLEGSRSGLPPHPHNSKLSSKEAGSPSCFSLGVLPPVPQGLRG